VRHRMRTEAARWQLRKHDSVTTVESEDIYSSSVRQKEREAAAGLSVKVVTEREREVVEEDSAHRKQRKSQASVPIQQATRARSTCSS